MTRILVTGGTGFIGRHLVRRLLAEGHEVHAAGRTAPGGDVVFHEADLLDAAAHRTLVAAAGATHLVHLAWYAEPGQYWRSPRNLDWVAASLGLVRAFAEAGGTRAVLAGTCAEYAWGPARLAERTSACRPATLYGAAKDGTRRVLEAYADEAGLSLAWGRVFFLYGPGERAGRLVSDAIGSCLAGERFATSAGVQRRDFSHVADIADAFAALLASDVTGPVDLGSGTAVPVRRILEEVEAATGRPGLVDFGARPLAGTEPEIIEADVTRLRDEVGFVPRFGLAAGIADTLASRRGA